MRDFLTRSKIPQPVQWLDWFVVGNNPPNINLTKLNSTSATTRRWFLKLLAWTAAGIILPNNQLYAATDPKLKVPYPNLKESERMKVLSNKLRNYCFVIDPGHWWQDSWATIKIQIKGAPQEIIEAPIVFDTSLRLLKCLMQNWAEAFLTHYTTDFWIKDTINPQQFRSQIYNLLNQMVSEVPTGQPSIEARRVITNKLVEIANTIDDIKIIFISLHADIAWNNNDNWINIHYNTRTRTRSSEAFAKELCWNLGDPNSCAIDQDLWILRHNHSLYKILVEIANMENIGWIRRLVDPYWREGLASRLCTWLIKTLA